MTPTPRPGHQRRAYKSTKPRVVRYTADNFALVPASMLPFKEQWRQLAGELPAGDVLLLVPSGPCRLRSVLHALVPVLRARGRHVTALPAEATTRRSPLIGG